MNQNSSENPGDSKEAKNATQKKHNVTVTSLLYEAISREFGGPINPTRFDAFIKNTGNIDETIISHMRDIQRNNLEEWGDIPKEDINSIKSELIIEQIGVKSKVLVLRRKKAFDRVIEIFPNIRQENNWELAVKAELAKYDEKKLLEISERTHVMKKMIAQLFPNRVDMTASEKANFQAVFGDIEEYTNDKGKIRLIKGLHRDYNGSGIDSGDISIVLGCYSGATAKRKKKILTDLRTPISLELALDSGIITEDYIVSFAKNNFGEIYEKMDNEGKRSFVNNLKKNKELVLSATEIDEGKIDKLFQTEDARRSLGEAIIRTTGADVLPETGLNQNSILYKAREYLRKKRRLSADDPLDEENDAIFFEYTEDTLGAPEKGKIKIRGIEKLRVGSVMAIGEGEDIKYIRIQATKDSNGDDIDVYDNTDIGLRLEGLPVSNGKILRSEFQEYSYDDFYAFLQNSNDIAVLSEEEFKSKLTEKGDAAGIDGKLYDARGMVAEAISDKNLTIKIDEFDSEGAKYGFGKGTYFEAPTDPENGKSKKKIWQVLSLSSGSAEIVGPRGGRQSLPLEIIYQGFEAGEFKRVAKITDDKEFITNLAGGGFGVLDTAEIKDNQLTIIDDDGHGKKKEQQVRCFESGNGGHIRITGIENGMVHFGEYTKGENSEAQDYAKKYGAKKSQKKFYSENWLTYGAFLDYLKKNKCSAASDDLLDPHAHSDHHHDEHHHYHLEGNLWNRIGKMQTPGSIWKGFEMITHSLQHTLEKGSKLDAAKFAMKTAKFLKLPDSIEAQLYADIVDGSKEITEKYKNKIGNLPGPKGRLKCIHIAHNKDARPEEVMAAIQFMVSGYGHLYAEDIKEYQTVVTRKRLENKDIQYHFLDAFIRTANMPGGDGKSSMIYWRLKAYDKAINEMGDKEAHEGEPTEEQLIHALFKSIDGNPEDFPYAASVVKAIGGPSGYEKAWKMDGFDNTYEKTKKQNTMVNAQGRLNKTVGYLGTHELVKFIAGMEQVAAKVKSPEYQAAPFVWAVGGFTKYMPPHALQKLKAYAENGLSFHAYAFMRKEEDNILYRNTVRLALQELIKQGKVGAKDIDEFDALCERMDNGPEDEKTQKKYGGPAPIKMMEFWQKHYNTGLHDMLQNTNGWLTKTAKTDINAGKYRDQLVGAHNMQLKDPNIPGGTDFGPDWYKEHGYENVIMSSSKDGLRSLGSMLNKIQFKGTAPGGRPMNEEHKEKIWNYIVNYMDGPLRDNTMFLGDEDLQRRQYFLHREEIINFLAEELSARTIKGREGEKAKEIIQKNIQTYTYYGDLFSKMGIEPMAVFDDSLVELNKERDYQAWKSGNKSRQYWNIKPEDVVGLVAQRAAGVTSNKKRGREQISRNTDTDRDPRTAGHSTNFQFTDSDN